jgi:two-component system, cell cycle sensor histidine kinase and response regulator CckA
MTLRRRGRAPADLERLRESESSYRRLFEVNPHPMWVYDAETLAFLTVNDAAVRRYGYSREEFLALSIRDIRPPEDVPALLSFVAGSGPGLEQAGLWRHRLKDGSLIDVEITHHPLEFAGRRSRLVLAFDVTERRRTEEALRWLQQAVEQTDDAVFMTRLDGTIAYVNPGFERLYNCVAEQVLGETPRFLKSGEMSADHYASLWHTLLAGRNYRGTHVNRTRDGRLVTVEASVTALRGPGDELLGFVAVHADISERRRLEDERRALEAQVVRGQRFEALGTLAAGAAHNFDNLLGVVLGHAGALARKPDDAAGVLRGAEAIRLSGERGADLVRQILTFARPKEHRIGVVDAWAVAREVERLLRDILPRPIDIVVSPDPGGAWVRCDHSELHQALLNLCLNARDAMPSGGTLSLCVVRTPGARVRTYCPEAGPSEYVELSVVDSGIGMDEETRQRVFEPFFTTKASGHGSGLGLAVVYGIVTAHGGLVAVESAQQRGSTFRIFLPLCAAPPAPDPAVEARPAAGRTILLVEDEEILSEIVGAWLRDAGYRVVAARDGETAVAAFREKHAEVDLVLCDLGLPGLGGRDVFVAARAVDPRVRFVILTGYVDPAEQQELLDAGVAAFLEKPCRVEDLLDVVGRALARPGSGA